LVALADKKRLYSPEEAAQELGVSMLTVRKWLRAGTLTGFKMGRLWRVEEKDLEEFIKKQRGDRDG